MLRESSSRTNGHVSCRVFWHLQKNALFYFHDWSVKIDFGLIFTTTVNMPIQQWNAVQTPSRDPQKHSWNISGLVWLRTRQADKFNLVVWLYNACGCVRVSFPLFLKKQNLENKNRISWTRWWSSEWTCVNVRVCVFFFKFSLPMAVFGCDTMHWYALYVVLERERVWSRWNKYTQILQSWTIKMSNNKWSGYRPIVHGFFGFVFAIIIIVIVVLSSSSSSS